MDHEKVWIVDDDRSIRWVLEKAFKQAEMDVHSFDNASDALKALKRDQPDVIISDVRMPGMDGIELMKKARTIVPTISTVIITAHGTIQTAITAIREGAYDYIEKPFCPEKVELLIRNLVEHHNLVEENITLRRKIEDRYSFEGIIAKSPKTYETKSY